MLMQWGQFVDHDVTGILLKTDQQKIMNKYMYICRNFIFELFEDVTVVQSYYILTATGQSRGFNGTVPQCCLPRGAGFQPPEFMVIN